MAANISLVVCIWKRVCSSDQKAPQRGKGCQAPQRMESSMSERRNITQPADWWAALKTQTPATTGVFSCAHHIPPYPAISRHIPPYPTISRHIPPYPGISRKESSGVFSCAPRCIVRRAYICPRTPAAAVLQFAAWQTSRHFRHD